MPHSVIIGSSGGIGQAISRGFLERGWSVTGMDIAPPTKSALSGSAQFRFVEVDLSQDASVENAVKRLKASDQVIDALIYAAGRYDHFPLGECEMTAWDSLMDVNVRGVVSIMTHMLPLMEGQKSRVVVISSETSLVSLPFQVYGLSKRMLENYLDALRQELAMIDIPVISVIPGAHDTALLRSSRQSLEEYDPQSRFAVQMQRVHSEGQRIIDKGAANPDAVARIVVKAATIARPRNRYYVNVAARFRVLSLLPARLRAYLIRLALRG